MSNVTTYDPFSLDQVSDLFQGLFRPLRGATLPDGGAVASMKIDVSESEGSYAVKAELPGVDRKDIDVQIDGRLVSINAKIERKKEEKEGERVIRRERYTGSISRSFTLASEIDEAKAAAQYQDGVLSLTLPKKAPAGNKRLAIG